MELFTTRKIISALVLLIVGVAITFAKGDIPEHLMSLMESLYYAFVLGNATQHVSQAYFERKNPEEKECQE